MNIIEPYARLHMINGRGPSEEAGVLALRNIEWIGRISHRSEDAMTEDSWKRFISAVVMQHGDWSIVEHSYATVDMLVDRGITHEIVRHRLFSFTQESTRFVNYEKKMPPSFVMPALSDDCERAPNGEQTTLSPVQMWRHAVSTAELMYRDLLKHVPPQIARSVFPNALASRILMTGNLRNWRHCFIMRTTKEAHPQMRQVTIPLLAEFKRCVPLLFDDIEPGAHQSVNIRLPR